MKHIILDGEKMTSKDTFHDEVAEKLGAPDYYGRNLDALYDVLTDLGKTRLTLKNTEAMRGGLGGYADIALTVLEEAAEYNDKIELEIL